MSEKRKLTLVQETGSCSDQAGLSASRRAANLRDSYFNRRGVRVYATGTRYAGNFVGEVQSLMKK